MQAWKLTGELEELAQSDRLRSLSIVDAIDGCRVRIGGRWGVAWCTNDYLGLSRHPRITAAAGDAAKRWGVGARASRLLAGTTQVHVELEAGLARWYGAEAAVVFASGYLANLGALSALLGPDDVVLIDRLAHASLVDACRASRATLRVFHHNDAAHARQVLSRYGRARRRLIVTEGLFSMDGDYAPVADLVKVAQAHDARVYLDDAHGAFAVGATGRGSCERSGVPTDDVIYMGTLGKALGCQGGFVIGPQSLIRLLHNRARTFIYATALAIPVAAAAAEALRVLEADAQPRCRLQRSTQWLQDLLQAADRVPLRMPSHIIPVVLGSSARALRAAARLWERGMFAPAIRPPTVPDGTARLRLSLSALHTPAQLEELACAIEMISCAASS